MNMKCYHELKKYGADTVMEREYAGLVASSGEADFAIEFDVEKEQARKDEIIRKASLLKTNAMSAVFEKAFAEQKGGKSGELMAIHYRDEEAIYVKSASDRVTVIFSTVFKEETDRIIGKVFLQEFMDCRRQPGLQNAPQALFNKEPPMELKGLSLKESENVGYVTFVLFPRHFEKDALKTIELIQFFRNYLHYHIKCSKAYMHMRMRSKVDAWMKVLNRAKPEVEDKTKKTASGKTFVRK